MITYQHVFDKIKDALSLRPAGTRVQVGDHEAAELLLLDYIEQFKNSDSFSAGNTREAHGEAVADDPLTLTWNIEFADTDYSYTINGFDIYGNPVEIYLISKSPTEIVIKTLVNATMTAIAMPY